jgi:hypothetical protein
MTLTSLRRHYRTRREDICYLRWTIESYDGMAVMRTVDPASATIEITVAPGCLHTLEGLLDSLVQREGLQIQREDHPPENSRCENEEK